MADGSISDSRAGVTRGVYAIPGKETRWKGITFRSRLETKWAVFFELLGLEWQYEPVDLGAWTPDFLIRGKTRSIYVEVKPITHFQIVPKLSSVPGEHLLLGTAPFECAVWEGFQSIGWWHGHDPKVEPCDHQTEAVLIGIKGSFRTQWGIMSDVGWYMDRVSGQADGARHICPAPADAEALWRDACDIVRTVYR